MEKQAKADKLGGELEMIVLEMLQRGADNPEMGHVHFRNGIACIAIAVFTLALACFIRLTGKSEFSNGLLGASIVQVLLGAWFVDRSTQLARRLGWRPQKWSKLRWWPFKRRP